MYVLIVFLHSYKNKGTENLNQTNKIKKTSRDKYLGKRTWAASSSLSLPHVVIVLCSDAGMEMAGIPLPSESG